MIASLDKINKFYNGTQVLDNISLTIEDNDRIGLIGRNGCGKSTLLKILTGKELPDHITEGDGSVFVSKSTSIGYLEQNSGLDKNNTIIAKETWEENHVYEGDEFYICLDQDFVDSMEGEACLP